MNPIVVLRLRNCCSLPLSFCLYYFSFIFRFFFLSLVRFYFVEPSTQMDVYLFEWYGKAVPVSDSRIEL